MGYNRSGEVRKKRLARRKRHMAQLERKAAAQQAAPPTVEKK